MNGWAGISAILKDVRSEKSALTDESITVCAEKARSKSRDFNKFEINLGAKDKELYAYLFRRLSKRMKATVAGTKSGFEVFRPAKKTR